MGWIGRGIGHKHTHWGSCFIKMSGIVMPPGSFTIGQASLGIRMRSAVVQRTGKAKPEAVIADGAVNGISRNQRVSTLRPENTRPLTEHSLPNRIDSNMKFAPLAKTNRLVRPNPCQLLTQCGGFIFKRNRFPSFVKNASHCLVFLRGGLFPEVNPVDPPGQGQAAMMNVVMGRRQRKNLSVGCGEGVDKGFRHSLVGVSPDGETPVKKDN